MNTIDSQYKAEIKEKLRPFARNKTTLESMSKIPSVVEYVLSVNDAQPSIPRPDCPVRTIQDIHKARAKYRRSMVIFFATCGIELPETLPYTLYEGLADYVEYQSLSKEKRGNSAQNEVSMHEEIHS